MILDRASEPHPRPPHAPHGEALALALRAGGEASSTARVAIRALPELERRRLARAHVCFWIARAQYYPVTTGWIEDVYMEGLELICEGFDPAPIARQALHDLAEDGPPALRAMMEAGQLRASLASRPSQPKASL